MKVIIDIPEIPTNDKQRWALANGTPYSYGEWIPCSERLPAKHGYYIVQTDGSHNDVVDIAAFGKYGNLVWGWNKASRVIAWMPLPEPYQKEGDR